MKIKLVNIRYPNKRRPSAPYRSAGKTIPPMWFVEILLRAHGDDPRRVDGFVAAIIVIADMREIHRFRNPRHLVDIAQETVRLR